MEEFQKIYIRKLSPKIEALQAAFEAIRAGDAEAEMSAKRIAHILRGSGGTYGFANITSLAEAVEDKSGVEMIHSLEKLISYLRFLREEDKEGAETILLVDDSDDIILIISTVLSKQGYKVKVAKTGAEANATLTNTNISIIILDLILPDTDGRNFLIDLKADTRTSQIPVLILSAKSSPQIKAECYALGADNYFEKPVDISVLTTQVASSIQHSGLKSTQPIGSDQIGLIKRDTFLTNTQENVKLAAESGSSCSLLAFSIAELSEIYGTHGHLSGDNALWYIAGLVKDDLPAEVKFSRFGENNYLALLPDMKTNQVIKVCSDLIHALSQKPYHDTTSGTDFQLSFSGGVVDAGQDGDLEAISSKVSQLMHRAKSAGSGQILGENDETRPNSTSILLAEDDDLTAEFIKHRLERTGYQITHHEHGDEAFEKISASKYDLIITDVKMPGMDGFELVQRTREGSPNKQTPIIMLTSMGRENDIARGLQLGADDYMLKPFSPIELVARVQRFLK